jgi:error-prone DNA polymerase
MIADYATTGLTVERHPLRLLRNSLKARGIVSSADLDELPHDADVRVAGLVVARQRPGTANGVVFLLLEDETGTVNIIVPPKVYERDRLTVRTEPLVMVEGKLERFASAGGAINILIRSVVPLDAPELLDRRPRAEVKDFSMLDARELARLNAEASAQVELPQVAVASAGGVTAAHVRSGPPPAAGAGRSATSPGHAASAGNATGGPSAREESDVGHDAPTDGAEDFRAVAPPIMSFAQGRRR